MDMIEQIRRERQAELNNAPATDREIAEARHGQVWDTDQMQAEFAPIGFSAPFIVVTRKADGAKGSLEFQHAPRFYFNFVQDGR